MTREVTRIDLSNNSDISPSDLLERMPPAPSSNRFSQKLSIINRNHSINTNNKSKEGSGSTRQHVTQLLLRRNGFEDLKKYEKAFQCMCSHLHELSLRENNFSYVPFEILCLTQLTSLSLASNTIQDIPEGTLCHLINLQWLSLSNNNLIQLPRDLAKCYRLKGLDVHSNEFADIPPVIFELEYLEVLLIQRNRIQHIPFAFPKTLHTLNLGFNRLDHIPSTLIDRPPPHMTHLYLSGNPLGHLPDDFLRHHPLPLASLDLHTCQLTDIAPIFFTFPAVRGLQRLNLAINKIRSIPPTIGLLTSLAWLNLNDNRLTMLPTAIGELTQLVKLGLVQNRLTDLPPRMFSRMHCLQKIDIRRNKLRYFPASILALAPLTEVSTVEEVGVPLAVFHVSPPTATSAHSTFSRRCACPPSCPVLLNHVKKKREKRGDHEGGSASMEEYGGGGSLRTMLFYENPFMDHRTGIFYKNKTLLTLDYADTLLEQEADLYTALNEASSSSPTTTCHSSKVQIDQDDLYHTNTNHEIDNKEEEEEEEEEELVPQVLSLREITVRTLLSSTTMSQLPATNSGQSLSPAADGMMCFEHMMENYNTTSQYRPLIDAFPKERQSFLNQVVSPTLVPEHIRRYIQQDTIHQCDHCGQWFNHTEDGGKNKNVQDDMFQIGYIARMCMERVRVPIRFNVCSRACALDAVIQLHQASKGWRTITLPAVQQLEHEDMVVVEQENNATTSSSSPGMEQLLEEVQFNVTNRISGWKQLIREGILRFIQPFQRRHHYRDYRDGSDDSSFDNVDPPPALIPVTRPPIHTSSPRTAAFNHLPRDAIRLERF